jgi:hypothetical protein
MHESQRMGIDPAMEKNLKTAVENTCELCREYFPEPLLEIHKIPYRRNRKQARDPSVGILVVCRLCHEHIHTLPLPVKKQDAIVKKRSFYVRRDIRRVLGYTPKPYSPPENTDLS